MKIGHRILILVGIVILIGLVWITNQHLQWQEENIMAQNERDALILTGIVNEGLEAIMLSGDADIAKSYANHIKHTKNIKSFLIMRKSGKEAFLDNETIEEVNIRLDEEEFLPREKETINQVLPQDTPELLKVIELGKAITSYETIPTSGENILTILAPIKAEKGCRKCHGAGEKVRGIIRLTTSLEMAREDIATSKRNGYLILIVALTIVGASIIILINLTVVKPINKITIAMANVAGGDYHQQLKVNGNDELSDMARSFNTMGKELFNTLQKLQNEGDKLTTIILSAKEGIIVTNSGGEIVLVNPAAERLLGKNSSEITKKGFMNFLDDQDYITALQDIKQNDVPPTVVYNNRILNINISTIKTNENATVGSAALIRDITQEKNLEQKLRKLSNTDGLTQLYNRRWFDEALNDEFQRAKRYNLQLALLFFDVDHFKKFNDEYGHDQGDKVLQSIGSLMCDHFRDIDHSCRYGGEEFCVIMPSTGFPGCEKAAERFRQKVEEMDVDGLNVTVSIGISIYPNMGTSPEDMLKKADEALYQAKRAGRNQIRFYQDDGKDS
ncbi:MAG: diguanylate cyclase [Magnetococcales bacterium]|nr:diguanylate cyclase [Magnetococcales bacterium]